MTVHTDWTEKEKAILRLVQTNLPDSLTPYAEIARLAGSSEEEVLKLLQQLVSAGVIRRFGASLKHQKAGYTHNAMVAWKVEHPDLDLAGAAAKQHPLISHCYFRPSQAEDWPYEFFTMIHGRSQAECHAVILQLQQYNFFKEYALLESIRELKKTSMSYF